MRLHDVEQPGQFESYYAANNLREIDEKIDALKGEMKIKATRYEKKATKEEILAGLEESVLFGNWKIA